MDQVRFYGNKVLAMSRDKDTAWYEAYLDFITSAVNFISQRAETIILWKGKSEGAAEFFNSVAAKVMQGDFEVSGPAESVSGTVAQAAPKAKPAAVSGNAADFRAAIDSSAKSMHTAAITLAIP